MTRAKALERWTFRRDVQRDLERQDRESLERLDALRLHYDAIEAGWDATPFMGQEGDAWKASARAHLAHLARVAGRRRKSPV